MSKKDPYIQALKAQHGTRMAISYLRSLSTKVGSALSPAPIRVKAKLLKLAKHAEHPLPLLEVAGELGEGQKYTASALRAKLLHAAEQLEASLKW